MDDLQASLERLWADHETQVAELARLQALTALYVQMVRSATQLSLPEMTRQIQILTEAVAALQQAVQVLEAHYKAWRDEAEKDVPQWWRAD